MSEHPVKPLATIDNAAWRQIIDTVPDIVYVTSPAGEFLDANSTLCHLLRMPRERIIGTTMSSHLQRDSATLYERVLHDLCERCAAERSTRIFTPAGTEPLLVEVNETPLLRDGRVWAIAGIGRDISQEAALERKLWDETETRQAAVDFALRTSLGLIKGYVFTLGHGGFIAEERRARFAQVIEEEIDHLAKIIGDLLDMRRLDSGEYDVPGEIVSVADAVQFAVEPCRAEAQRRQIRLEVSLPPEIQPVYVPLEALIRVLQNLIQNAVHHTLHNGSVWISVHDSPDYVEITVRDSGVGIPVEDLPYIFDRYYRGRSSAASPVQGIGMGLAVSRTLVEAMGGKISVQSKVGTGSTFQVVVPRRALLNDVRAGESWAEAPPVSLSVMSNKD